MVKQRTTNDCGIAAVANALGTSYAKVKGVFGRLNRGGMERHEVAWLLSEFGEWKSTTCRWPLKKMDVWLPRHDVGQYVVSLRSDWLCLHSHLVAVVDGQVLGEYSEEWPVLMYHRLTGRTA